MSALATVGLVDLIALALVVGAAISTLRRGRGLLAAAASALATAVVVWVLAVAVASWAPAPAADAAQASRLVRAVPVPNHALHQAEQLFGIHVPGRNPR